MKSARIRVYARLSCTLPQRKQNYCDDFSDDYRNWNRGQNLRSGNGFGDYCYENLHIGTCIDNCVTISFGISFKIIVLIEQDLWSWT